jgi:hypothetical protein
MKQFLIKTGYYLLMIVAFSSILLFIIYKNPHWVDRYYLKVTTPKANSLILGTSRASQGILPQIMNDKLIGIFEGEIINHSFTMGLSPYGPAYEKFMKQKMKDETKNGLFILEVSPSAFCALMHLPNDTNNIVNDTNYFTEQNSFVGKITNSSVNPNIQYLSKFYNERHFIFEHLYSVMANRDRAILDNNIYGSMNVSVKADTVNLNFRLKRRLKYYIKEYEGIGFSQARFDAFARMVQYLKERGEVYIIRLPIAELMMKEEMRIFPEFDQKMEVFAKENNLKYFNFIHVSKNYITTDGSHLYHPSAELLTEQLCDSIIRDKITCALRLVPIK